MKNRLLIISFTALLIVQGCGPVGMFTKLKKLPHEYSQNYSTEGVKAPRNEQHHRPWVVYSDRSNNSAFTKAGGRIKSKEFGFGDPFLVIGEKKQYLQLIKYNPNNSKNNRFTERKTAEYIGWADRAHLLLSPTSVTDIGTGLKTKMLTAISDTIAIMQSGRFFKEADSLLVFTTPSLSDTCTKVIGLHQIVYALKTSADGNNSLICRTQDITTERAKWQMIGWIPNVMLQNIGQQIFAKTELTKVIKQPNILKYSPVHQPRFTDSTVTFYSGTFLPVIDKSKNSIYNINGEAVSFNHATTVKKDLQHVNIIFAIEAGYKSTEVGPKPTGTAPKPTEQYPPLLNIIQNLSPMFASIREKFNCRFGAVVATENKLGITGLTTDYTIMTDSLATFINKISASPKNPLKPWSALEISLKTLKPYKNQTNVIIVIGDRVESQSELAPKHISTLLAELNCRLLGIQLYASNQNVYNNFVLQLTNMIEEYAAAYTTRKRHITFFANQFCRKNTFREFGDNFYALDYPSASMSQGGILFPEKGEQIHLERITPAIDSLFNWILSDNTLLIKSIESAFLSVGNTKDKYNTLLIRKFGLSSDTAINSSFKKLYNGKKPVWYKGQQQITIHHNVMQYKLLLNDPEFKKLETTLESLCPNTDAGSTYTTIRKTRKRLIKFYLSEIQQSLTRKKNRNSLTHISLAQAHKQIFGAPSNLPLLHNITIKELKNKKQFTDSQLEDLIRYFKYCKKKSGDRCYKEKVISGSETYYYIDSKLLP